jgi:sarcosine oxidase subunit delta
LLLIDCPYCGPRAEIEFRYAGEAHIVRPTPDVPDEAWADYLHTRTNKRGPHAERWRHIHGCGQFFNAVRDTYTDSILKTYPCGHDRPLAGNCA